MSHSRAVIVGAGPYGLSVAAHLQSAGIEHRIFGKPMHRWLSRMPKGMFLKSEINASSLFEPEGRDTLPRYYAEQNLPHAGPIPLGVFTAYAQAFQRRHVPSVEEALVTCLDSEGRGFRMKLANGETATADNVIVATGLDYTEQMPEALQHLPRQLCSHTSSSCEPSQYRDREVTVIGAGQSALETAALLFEAGASVHLVARENALVWNQPPAPRSCFQRLYHPDSPLGCGLGLWLYSTAPMLFRHLPRQTRAVKVRYVLGPSGSWWLKDRVLERFRVSLGYSVRAARESGGRVILQAAGADGRSRDLISDHVVAATGYRFDVDRLPFLGQTLKRRLHVTERLPDLSPNFESSVPGLYFIGFASTIWFGPSMRFLCGAKFAARRVCRDLAASRRRRESSSAAPLSGATDLSPV